MTELLVALKMLLELAPVAGALGVLDAGLNVASLFDAMRSRFKKDSVEYQLVCALDESLNEACSELGWEYDSLAVFQEFDLDSSFSGTMMTRDGLRKLFTNLVGMDIDNNAIDVIIDCFDKSVADKDKLHRYLEQKWNRCIAEEKIVSCKAPKCLTTIRAAVDLIGREEDVEAIRDLFTKNNIVAIRAGGGVGKTALAARIINDMKDESQFDHFAWITSSGNLEKDLSTLDIPLDGTGDDKFTIVKRFLQQKPTFLVIDNLDTLPSDHDILVLNTIGSTTKIMITTRARINKFQDYPLDKMDRQATIALFYKYYLDITDCEEREDREYVESIVDAAYRNAYVIELIAKMACWEYTEKLGDLWDALKDNVFGVNSEIDIETDHEAGEDLRLQGQITNLYQMSNLSDTQKELMQFFSLFPAETVIFADTFKWAGFSVRDIKFLAERGWILKSGEGYLIHTETRGSVRLQSGSVDIDEYGNLIDKLCDTKQYMSEGMIYTKIAERIVVPETVCRLLDEKASRNESTALLNNNIGLVHMAQGDYVQALKHYEKALKINEKVLGFEHPGTATTYNNIARVYQVQGDYSGALDYYEKALKINEKVLGFEHPGTATMYNNIAAVYSDIGNYVQALKHYEKALKINEKVLGFEHPSTATTYNNIAGVYQVQGDYVQALILYEKALKINEKVLGFEHPSTATTYNNIAGVYQIQGDYSGALEYYEKALKIRKKVLGLEHPSTATTYNSIAELYMVQGDYFGALEYYEKALKIRKKVLGLEHPSTATTYNNIARVYQVQGNYSGAIDYYEKALKIKEEALGFEHLDTAATYNSIAGVYMDQGDYAQSLEYYRKALMIVKAVVGLGHPFTAATYNNIAGVYMAEGNYTESLENYGKALEISENVLGPDHPSTATAYCNVAVISQELGNYVKSLDYHKKALKIREKMLGTKHPDTAMAYNNIAGVYKAIGDYDRAIEYYGKALEINEKVFGFEHPGTATTYNNIAGVCGAKGDYAQALKYYEKALKVEEAVFKPGHPSTATTYNNIATVYQVRGDYNKAHMYYKKALKIREVVLGVSHPETAKTYSNIGGLYYQMGDYMKARQYSQKAYDILMKALGSDHSNTEIAKEWLEEINSIINATKSP